MSIFTSILILPSPAAPLISLIFPIVLGIVIALILNNTVLKKNKKIQIPVILISAFGAPTLAFIGCIIALVLSANIPNWAQVLFAGSAAKALYEKINPVAAYTPAYLA
tara:strand:+ start:440 stop:763 length:324 start_codon:yes stop_codon:yes gene_type:complete